MPADSLPQLCVVILESDDPQELAVTLGSLRPCLGQGVEIAAASRRAAPEPEPGLNVRGVFLPLATFEQSMQRAAETARAGALLFIRSGYTLEPGGLDYVRGRLGIDADQALSGVLKAGPFVEKIAGVKALELAFGQELISSEACPAPLLTCLAVSREAFLTAGGASDCAQGQARDPELGEKLLARGVEVVHDPGLCARISMPDTLGKALHREADRAGLRYLSRRLARPLESLEIDPQPGGYVQPMLPLLALGILVSLMPYAPDRAVSLSLLCLLFLYPLNRGFLKRVRESSPELVLTALVYCLARAPVWALGLLGAALGRFNGSKS